VLALTGMKQFCESELDEDAPLTPPSGVRFERIFLAHGRDERTRETVARLLEKVGQGRHEVVTLQERTNRGRTLIEKFEEHAAQASYAVILLTGDDVGRGGPGEGLKPRARQNVIFEMGFFCGSIKRSRVAVLYEPGVERPSDVEGLAYIELDPAGAWKTALVRELCDAGLECDLAAI
jgi:predicted nucleotide-binding protein